MSSDLGINRSTSSPPLPLTYSENSSCWEKIFNAYQRMILYLLECIKPCSIAAYLALTTILLEPCAVIRAVFDRLIYGWGSPRFSNVNPVVLTPEQLDLNPVLLIHGNYDMSTAFTGIAESLNNSYNPAVFTVDLPSGMITAEDYRIIEEKIKEIWQLFKKEIQIDFVGHSRGARIASACRDCEFPIRKTVLLGYRDEVQENVRMINGSRDHLLSRSSDAVFPKTEQIIPGKGHLSLLHCSAVHAAIIDYLRPASSSVH